MVVFDNSSNKNMQCGDKDSPKQRVNVTTEEEHGCCLTDRPLLFPSCLSLIKIQQEILHQFHNSIAQVVIVCVHLKCVRATKGRLDPQRDVLSEPGVGDSQSVLWMLCSGLQADTGLAPIARGLVLLFTLRVSGEVEPVISCAD